MSDKKISQLTAATTADGTEPLPIVQSGETKKATGKVVVSGAVSDLAQTWNAAGTTFTGLKLNVTDTASASGSLLADLQVGGASQFSLSKAGALLATGFGRFGDGFRFQGSGSAFSGTGVGGEFFVAGSVAYLTAYNRTTLGYAALSIYGSTVQIQNGTERALFGASSVVFNDPGADYDFRVEGDTDANLLFVDASTDRVGIGTNTPANKFVVSNGGANGFEVNPIAGESSGVSLNGYNRSTVAYTPLTYIALSHYFRSGSSPANVFVIDSSGNLLLGGTTSPTTGTKSLTITTGTAPTASPADTFTIYSSDVSAGNTTLSIYTEGTPVSDSTDNAVTKKIAVRINGTLYYLLADTDNS